MIVISRRELLKLLSGGMLAAPVLNSLDPLYTLAQAAGNSGKTLIVLNLEGGVDHLSAFPYLRDPAAPSGQGGFVAELEGRRPNTFRLPDENLMANDYLGFNSAFSSLFPEFSADKLALIQSIGISPGQHPGGSHNLCQNIYSFADRNFDATSKAWIADYIDRNSLERTYGFGTGGRVDFTTDRKELTPIVGMRAEDLTYTDPFGGARRNVNFNFSRRFAEAAATPSTAQEGVVARALDNSLTTMEFMSSVAQTTVSGNYPVPRPPYWFWTPYTFQSIGRTIRRLEADGDMRPRLFYAFQGGFDTHAGQANYLDALLKEVSDSLAALITDLKACGAYDRTVIIAISEFARTAWENGGAGTDHGWGTTLFTVGGAVKGGVRGEPPQLSYMQTNNECRALIDFRNVIKETLDWMGLPVAGDDIVAPGTYARSPLGLFNT
jgi:uncharacterized protein (DUF1501 family)